MFLCNVFDEATSSPEASSLSAMICSLSSSVSSPAVDRSSMVVYTPSAPSGPSMDLSCCTLS